MARPRVFIEEDFPVEVLGIESRRERGASSALPPLYFLHVWWARRPLTISRAAVLGSLLPVKTDAATFLEVLGIKGDAVKAFKQITEARSSGERIKNPYGYDRAFTYIPDDQQRKDLAQIFESMWMTSSPTVLDPMSGGGSIPFSGLQLNLNAVANDLNPVAYVILKATLQYPKSYGMPMAQLIRDYGSRWSNRVRKQIGELFKTGDHEEVLSYLWAHSIHCSACGYEIPLSPNWWIRRDSDTHLAVRPLLIDDRNRPEFEMVDVKTETTYDPDQGTVRRGAALCPRCHNLTDGESIKSQAQTGKMGFQLYAVVYTTGRGREFRLPTPEDEQAASRALRRFERNMPAWQDKGVVPDEPYPVITNDARPTQYGMSQWKDMYSPRQLLSLVTYLEVFHEIKAEVLAHHSFEEARAILTYLAFAIDKCADRNSRMTRWIPQRQVIANTFDRHDYAFSWSFSEMNLTVPGLGFEWAVGQVVDAYEGICKLLGSESNLTWLAQTTKAPEIRHGSATDLFGIGDSSVHAVVVDPPYYDNVMYAEMADFFYVWQKRTIGDLYPEVFLEELTDKTSEAVANPSLFTEDRGIKPQKQAEQNYQAKMQEVFQEIYRVLRDDGVLTLMFTHKRVEAWDTLASALIHAGFEITASWPVHTEFEHSMHIASKNSAESTIMLVCRKREASQGGWWDELLPLVRERVLERAKAFEAKGFRKLDLMLATYGPALQVLSEHWPVKDSTGQLVQPERVLEEARSLVTQLRVTELVQHRQVVFDPVTRWYLLAWDVFGAEKFPYDEGRLLAMTCGIELDRTIIKEQGVATKSGKYVVLQSPEGRMDGHRRGDVERAPASLLDGLHLALNLHQRDGAIVAGQYLAQHNLQNDAQFQAMVDACLLAIPRIRPEWKVLQSFAVAHFRHTSQVLEQITLDLASGNGVS